MAIGVAAIASSWASPAIPNLRCEFGFAACRLLAGCRGTGGRTLRCIILLIFICPGCGACYKVVRVKAEADPPHRLIHCKVCIRSLAPTDREYILKYFLISRRQAAKQRV